MQCQDDPTSCRFIKGENEYLSFLRRTILKEDSVHSHLAAPDAIVVPQTTDGRQEIIHMKREISNLQNDVSEMKKKIAELSFGKKGIVVDSTCIIVA